MSRRPLAFKRRQPCGVRRAVLGASAAAAATLLAACGSLFAPGPPAPHIYTLDTAAPMAAAPRAAAMPSPGASAPVMIVALPRAAAGFDTDRIVYVHEGHRLQPYADNQWIDTPSKMLEPLIAAALSSTGAFGAVLPAASPVTARWELQSDIVRFQHDVVAARFRFTLRVALIEKPTRTVVLAREFDAGAPVADAGPPGAVAAANVVVAEVLQEMAAACADEIARRR